MPATVTLSTTTLQQTAGASDSQIKVESTSGMFPGTRLWIDRELMTVVSLGVSPWVNVLRGVDGTSAQAHSSLSTVTIGRGDQFYSIDPVGRPFDAISVSPYINVLTGDVWLAQGDAQPDGTAVRWWQKVTTTYGVGALGVRTTTQDPTAST
jgi:hypothetical protein